MCVKPECKSVSRLPNEAVCFNPSNEDEVEALLQRFGPEGVWEIAQVLQKAALDDMDVGMRVWETER
jgi:hypothetical protein